MSELDDFSRYARIIPEEHQPALRKCLRKIPDFSWLLSEPHPEKERLQGDLLREFPAVFLDDAAAPRLAKFTVMILNNTCDLPEGRLDFVTAAPVVDFQKYLEYEEPKRSPDSLENYARSIRNNDKTELFYLPKITGFDHGALVLLHLVCSISAKVYHEALRAGQRVASFSQVGFYSLLIKLTTHLARTESTEVNRSGSEI
jgi:hypothetical protein